MEIRHLGFDLRANSRPYRFDVRTDGMTRQVSITGDSAVFCNRGIGYELTGCRGASLHRYQGASPMPNAAVLARRRAGGPENRNTTEVILAPLRNVMVANAICKK